MIEILVPVLGRKHQIEPLLENIAGATTEEEWRVTLICSPSDPARRCAALAKQWGANLIVVDWEPDRADFAKKINHAYSITEGEWFFQGATDLVFHPGWASEALKVARLSLAGVIGTNDLGNPDVKKGNHATHILFSRSYIETYGGTFDGTGVVFSEAYDHQYVDTEFVQTATLRNQFRPCLRAVVEHMHPHWGKGESDETYAKSTRDTHGDASIYHNRMRAARRAIPVYARRRW